MANCHDNFTKSKEGKDSFKKAITISDSEKERLVKSRDSLRDKIRIYFSDKEKVKGPKFHCQGSYSMETLLSPVADGKEYDLDDGIYLDLTDYDDNTPSPSTIHDWIVNAVKDHTSTPPVDKNPCVRVTFQNDYHIDLPAYKVNDGWDGENYELAKKSGWERASAKAVSNWFNSKAKDNSQIRKIVKYAKAWSDYKRFSNNQTFIPNGLTLTVLFTEEFVADERDDISFAETARAVNNRVKYSKKIFKPIKGTPESEDLGSSKYISDAQWEVFYSELDRLVEKSDQALDEERRKKSAEEWRKVFGDRFPIYDDAEEDTTNKAAAIGTTSIIGRSNESA